jgi:hypothetical protein
MRSRAEAFNEWVTYQRELLGRLEELSNDREAIIALGDKASIAELENRIMELERLQNDSPSLDLGPEIGYDAPPELAELLLTFCARASQDEFAAGDMREIFVRDCTERGRSRAARLYWSSVLGYLFRRSLRLAAVVGFIKKLFVG